MNDYLHYDLNFPKRYGPFLERWKDVEGFEGLYKISDYGRCESLTRLKKYKDGRMLLKAGRMLILYKANNGYIRFGFCVEGKIYEQHSHVLVAKHFIPNSQNKPEVNHKDGIKSNPFIGNLEWVTASENHLHAFRTGLQWCYQSKLVLDTATGIYFDNIKYTEKSMGWYRGKLSRMLQGKIPNTTGFILVGIYPL